MGEEEGVLLDKISLLMLSGIHVDCWCYSFCIHTSIVSSILYYSRTTMSATEAWHNGRSLPATSFLWDLKAAQTSSSRPLLIISTMGNGHFKGHLVGFLTTSSRSLLLLLFPLSSAKLQTLWGQFSSFEKSHSEGLLGAKRRRPRPFGGEMRKSSLLRQIVIFEIER